MTWTHISACFQVCHDAQFKRSYATILYCESPHSFVTNPWYNFGVEESIFFQVVKAFQIAYHYGSGICGG